MTNHESDRFNQSLSSQFDEHDKKVVLTILEGDGVYNQEDIITFSNHSHTLLRKLGWIRKVKKAIKDAGLQIDINTH